MYYLGWMSLAGREVFNVDRTLTYLRANVPTLDLAGCDECGTLALALGEDVYKNNPVDDPAPWIAADEPDLDDFYGFMPMTMEGLYDSTVEVEVTQSIGDGGSISTPRLATREVRVTGVLIAGTRIALAKSRAWLRGTLGGSGCATAGDCGGDDMCFFADCPSSITEADDYQRTLKDVVLSAGPTMLHPYGQLTSGAWMDAVEFTLVAATPWVYGQVKFLGSSVGTEDTTPGGEIFPVEIGETHGHMNVVNNLVPFPATTAEGDLVVVAFGANQINNAGMPGWNVTGVNADTYVGSLAWKIAEQADIDLGYVDVRLNTNGNGDYTCLSFQAGTFDPDVPVQIDFILVKGSNASQLPQVVTPFNTTAKALGYHMTSRNTLDQVLFLDVGTKRWATSSNYGGSNNNGALYSLPYDEAVLLSPVWDADVRYGFGQGAFYVSFEVMPTVIPPILTLDPTPPQLPDCTYSAPAPITDPTLPAVPAPPRPPAVLTSLQPPAPYRAGYSLYIPEDQVPLATDAVLIITLTTGNAAARWVRLRLYTAPMGVTQEVSDLDPCSFCGDITVMYIPPNSTMVIDGMNQTVYIEDTAGNTYPANHLVYSTGGVPVRWPSVTCGMGHWLTVEFAGEGDPSNMFITGATTDSATFSSDLGAWTSGVPDGSPRAVRTRDTAQFHLAPASMKVNWPQGSTDRPQVVLSNLVIGHEYILSAWVKSPVARITVALEDQTVQANPNANWVEVDLLVAATASTMIAWIARDTTGASGDVWVDEFGLHDVTGLSNSIVQVGISTAKRE